MALKFYETLRQRESRRLTLRGDGVGIQIRIKPRELALLIKSLEALQEANRQDPAILGLFPRDAYKVIAFLKARLALAIMKIPSGGLHAGPSPRVRLNGHNLTLCRLALECLVKELNRNPNLLPGLTPQVGIELAERLSSKLGVYLMREQALEDS